MPLLKLLLCTASAHFGRGVSALLERHDLSVRVCTDLADIIPILGEDLPDLVVCGWRFHHGTAFTTLQQVAREFPHVPLLVWSSSLPDEPLPWPRLAKPCRLDLAVEAFLAAARPV
ncbi:hypothetical protein ABS71_20810 [bacterium SCN 62-11]|nr:MAG: hypothetical protein ABS71_20810 [bacterium SCN 62-11]